MTDPRSLSNAQGKRRRLLLACAATIGLASLAWARFAAPLPRLTYNPSDSVAVGWYRVDRFDRRHGAHASQLHVDSIVLVAPPAPAAALAAQRGYLPTHVPLLKRVAAVWPQQVCLVGDTVRIDGEPAAVLLAHDRLGRALPPWRHCRQLERGELFLLSATNAASFDSRYFGPVDQSQVLGIAHPLRLRAQR